MASEIKNYETFYSGGYSSLNPEYGNYVGFRLSAGALGSPTGIQTANQLNEVVARMREGVKNVELQPLQPDVFEQIPKQHFNEIRALMKLSGVKPSVHAPMIDPAGFGEKGYGGDVAREDAERRLWNVVEKSHELDPQGNTPIVIHSSGGVPGREWRPGKTKEGKEIKPGEKGRFEEFRGIAINRDTGQMADLKREKLFRPTSTQEELDIEAKEGTLFKPEDRIHSINAGEWENKLTELAQFKKHANEIMGDAPVILGEKMHLPASQNFIDYLKKTNADGAESKESQAYNKMQDADIFLENARLGFNGAFEKAFKYGEKEQRKKLKDIAKDYQEKMKEASVVIGTHKGEEIRAPIIGAPAKKREALDNAIHELARVTSRAPPETFVPVEEFAMEKAAETMGNLAAKSYEKYGKNAPILALENMYQGFAFARAKDMKELVKASKKKFIDNATVSKKNGGLGLSESKAKKAADKMLGVTWDVGHLNIMRKHGFTKEDIVKETEKIAPLVKHIHLTDNFGYSDSHLLL